MATSVSSSGGFVARIKRALGELKGKDGTLSRLYVDGEGRLHVVDKASDIILGAIKDGKLSISLDEVNTDVPVSVLNFPTIQEVRAKVASTPFVEIQGIVTGAAYASGDAFGSKFSIDVPKIGVLQTAIMLDLDDEGIETELWLFRNDFTATTDNAAFAVSDADLLLLEAVIGITNFANAGNNQVGINNGLNLPYTAPEGKLLCQCVTRGVPNIAAINIPRVALRIISYE